MTHVDEDVPHEEDDPEGQDDRDDPEDEVMGHMEAGLQMARDDFHRATGGDDDEYWETLAIHFLKTRLGVLVNPPDPPSAAFLAKWDWPGFTGEMFGRRVAEIPQDPKKQPRFLRYAIEIGIAELGVSRTYVAWRRYSKLEARLVNRVIPEKARRYVEELSNTYLFGLDAACIALACSCFEQVAKAALHATGNGKGAAGVEVDGLAADGLRLRLYALNLIDKGNAAARNLIRNRNKVLHRELPNEKVIAQQSLDSIEEFLVICSELEPSWPHLA